MISFMSVKLYGPMFDDHFNIESTVYITLLAKSDNDW